MPKQNNNGLAANHFNPVAAAGNVEEFMLYVSTGDLAMIRMELKGNPELVNVRDKNGTPALHQAVHWAQDEAVALLLERGAHPATPDENGASAAGLARQLGFTPIAEMIEAKAQEIDEAVRANERRAQLQEAIDGFSRGNSRDIVVERPKYPWEK